MPQSQRGSLFGVSMNLKNKDSESGDIYSAIPDVVKVIGERVASSDGVLYIVGGWVRDMLRGIPSSDIDLATNLKPSQVKELISDLGKMTTIGERFGTITLLPRSAEGPHKIEITTFRREEYQKGSRHPQVEALEEIDEDLSRRDFTINAIALRVVPKPNELIDPFGGITDIRRKLLRTPRGPNETMAEDPLRMMRASRFAAELGFDLDAELHSAIEKNWDLLGSISRERQRDELERILISPYPDRGLRLLLATGLARIVLPELCELEGVEQPKAYHRADVFEHTLLTIMYTRPLPLLRRAALFHDFGKPRARVSKPKVMFPEHEKIGAKLTDEAMARLRYSKGEIKKTSFIVRYHMRPIRYDSDWSDSAIRRLIRDCTLVENENVVITPELIMELARADIKAGNLESAPIFLEKMDKLEKRIASMRENTKPETLKSPLDGNELMDIFKKGPGSWIREVKSYLENEVISGRLHPEDKEKARQLAEKFLQDASNRAQIDAPTP